MFALLYGFLFYSIVGCKIDGNFIGETSMSTQTVTINSIDFDVSSAYKFFTWNELPSNVIYEREPVQSFTFSNGVIHYYEAVYISSGNLNWFQAAYLAQDAGGYLVSLTNKEENTFVFDLVSDEKYFWTFLKGTGRMNHYQISIGPFLGGYQPVGSEEPKGGWRWLSGEAWNYSNWAENLDDGITDKDPRGNTQPSDSGNSRHGQRVMGFGEMNIPVATWGDYMDDVGTYGQERTPGRSYGFIIEYESNPY